MNPFFVEGEGRPGFPRRAFARLDDIEPIAPRGDEDLTFVFDAVDADWDGFGDRGQLNLNSPNLGEKIAQDWRQRLAAADEAWRQAGGRPPSPAEGKGGRGSSGGQGQVTADPDPYDEVPVYRIEFTLARDHSWFEAVPRSEEPWISLELTDQETDVPVDVYGGLFAAPTLAFLKVAPATNAPAAALNAVFDMDAWPDASASDVVSALGSAGCGSVDTLVCFDIGQGSASALVCPHGYPAYYYDVGRGSGRNRATSPARVDFCTCLDPPVILSHWDTDHWVGAKGHSRLHGQTWVTPRQKISTTHTLLANDILKAGGRVLVVPAGTPPMRWTVGGQEFDLRRCTATSGRNGTGLALVVTDKASGRAWVLTGDAAYNELPHAVPAYIAALVAPHHGADMGSASVPFGRSSHAYARLIYSFGPGNTFGKKKSPVQHPVQAAVLAHMGAGWVHGSWAPPPPGHRVAGSDVLATGAHASTHLDGAAATFAGGSPSLHHLSGCPNALPVTQS